MMKDYCFMPVITVWGVVRSRLSGLRAPEWSGSLGLGVSNYGAILQVSWAGQGGWDGGDPSCQS